MKEPELESVGRSRGCRAVGRRNTDHDWKQAIQTPPRDHSLREPTSEACGEAERCRVERGSNPNIPSTALLNIHHSWTSVENVVAMNTHTHTPHPKHQILMQPTGRSSRCWSWSRQMRQNPRTAPVVEPVHNLQYNRHHGYIQSKGQGGEEPEATEVLRLDWCKQLPATHRAWDSQRQIQRETHRHTLRTSTRPWDNSQAKEGVWRQTA